MTAEVELKDLNLSTKEPVHLYLSTLKPSSATYDSTYSKFTGPSSHNLILNKGLSLEVYDIVNSGLEPKLNIPILGRVTVLKSFRPAGLESDLLAVLTEKADFFVLRHDAESNEVVTLFSANLMPSDCIPTRIAHLATIDCDRQLIAIHVAIGVLEVIPFLVRAPQDILFKKAVRVRLSELDVYSLAFIDPLTTLEENALPVLAVLHRLPMKLPQVKVYHVKDQKGSYTLEPTNYTLNELSDDADIILRLGRPRCGFLVIGSKKIVYSNPAKNEYRQLNITPTYFTAVSPIDPDGFRHLLASSDGALYILLLVGDGPYGKGSMSLRFEKLGIASSVASSLTYLDDGVVYMGSQYGDSLLIRLSSEATNQDAMKKQYFQVMETYPSLAPITDFCVRRRAKLCSEQDELILASGVAGSGCLKIVSSGVEAFHYYVADWPDSNVTGIFPITNPPGLHIATSLSTRAFTANLESGELTEQSVNIDSHLQTIYLSQIADQLHVQVTSSAVLVADSTVSNRNRFWPCPSHCKIQTAASLGSLVLLYTTDHMLRLLKANEAELVHIAELKVDQEVACLSLHEVEAAQTVVLISFWETRRFGYVAIDKGLEKMSLHFLDHIPASVVRSACLITAGPNAIACFGTGDGTVLMFNLSAKGDKLQAEPLDRIELGIAPVRLYDMYDSSALIAVCEEPYLLTWRHGEMIHSVINNMPRNVSALSKIMISGQSGFVCYGDVEGSERKLVFCKLQQNIQPRVHVKSVHVGQSVHKIVHMPEHGLLAVLLHNFPALVVPVEHWPKLRSQIVLYDDRSFEVKDRYELKYSEGSSAEGESRFCELGWALAVGGIAGLCHSGMCLVVGTGLNSDDPQLEQGRLLVFQIGEGKRLRLVSSNEMKGAVKAVAICSGQIVACVRGMNVLLRWDYQSARKLVKASASGGHIDGTCISQWGNVLAIGDSLTSVSFCLLNKDQGKLSEIARAHRDRYLTAVQLVDYKNALAADITGNLSVFSVEKDQHCEYTVAVQEGAIYCGDLINAIMPASLSPKMELSKGSFIAVSASGVLYSLHVIGKDTFAHLQQVQKALQTAASPVGGIKHASFRRSYIDSQTQVDQRGVIDGDLLAKFLALPPGKMNEIAGFSGKLSPSQQEEAQRAVTRLARMIEQLSFGI